MTKKDKNVSIQFVKGKDEKNHPEIRMSRNRDGKKGQAIYIFHEPQTITLKNFKSIQKMYLIDEEGELLTKKIDLSITDECIKEVKSTFNWNTEKEFERFMRFSRRYANTLSNY